MASKRYAAVERRSCVACGSCLGECPRGAVRVEKGCWAEVDQVACVGCGKCAKVCPTGCITLAERGTSA